MLKISNVSKRFNKIQVFDNLSYEFKDGVYILMGQNGSGKSTLFKMIAGLDKKYLGDIEAKNVFMLPEKLVLPKSLTVNEMIEHYAKINNSTTFYNTFLARYNLENKKIKSLSKGMVQKVGIILSLIANYDIILYDEPLEGLDEEAIKTFFDDVKQIKNTIVIISLHEIPKNIRINATKLRIKDGIICEQSDR